MIRNAVIHLNGEQPIVVDLFEMPGVVDLTVRCTNLRTLDGKRPVFADDKFSIFYFPYTHIRFIEIVPASLSGDDAAHVPVAAGVGGRSSELERSAEPETDLEIDEDFLRRIREV